MEMVARLVVSRTAALIFVTGVVQGVGFRPFVYRTAAKLGLRGYVRNLGGSEVEIWVEGADGSIEKFLEALEREKPPPARLERVVVKRVEPRGYASFAILESGAGVSVKSQIPPDIGVCDDCLREVLNSSSRWYKYPFNSCAWCGPRFSMMYAVPYDRKNTAMRDFPLCSECEREYSDPRNERRFHAQGISCPRCGPKLKLLDHSGEPIDCEDPIAEAAKLIEEGAIVAVKGVGGFHLAALASDDKVVEELRRRKRRPQKPFAIMAIDVEAVLKIAEPSELHLALLTSPQRPIVLVPKKVPSIVSPLVAPGLSELGVMLPYTPMHYLLVSETKDKFLIMTSGNRKGLPICKGLEALRELKGIADYYLVHNREIVNRVDDSVLRLTDGEPQLLRRSRGYAPAWLELPFNLGAEAVALGAHLDNAGAVAFENKVVPTQYVGDMDNLENAEFLLSALDFLMKSYRVKPQVIASDKHPNYATTELAAKLSGELGIPHVRVQHHHAHIASAMASRNLPRDSEVVGIALDGVGYGDDGMVWGGEVLLASYIGYRRVGHLEYLPLPGGDRSTLYPARIAAAALAAKLGPEEALKVCLSLGLERSLPGGARELELAARAFAKPPFSSSVGRFLDAVSALLGVCNARTYEGEPAVKLEAAARGGQLVGELKLEVEGSVVLTSELLLQLLELNGRHSVRDLSYTVQVRLGEALGLVVRDELGDLKLPAVLSGGAAVNDFIVKGLRSVLRNVLLPQGIPAGDGGLAVGQVVSAALSLDNGQLAQSF
jgi:hydrogenase maturation protein HypF